MADVFLSYASKDADRAQAVATQLEDAGYSVWWDRELLSGQRFTQSIQRELGQAAAVVVMWTKASIESEWVYSEARRGSQRGVLVQVRTLDLTIDDIPPPFDAFHCSTIEDTDALLRSVAALAEASSESVSQDSVPEISIPSTQPGPERKVVTALVAELDATSGLDPEDYESVLSPYKTRLRQAAEEFGGTPDNGSGMSVTALFGVPRSHEDDPERAVRSALAMVAAAAELTARGGASLTLRVGISTGQTLVSADSVVTGDIVTVAHRLQAAAPEGAILVSQETYAATRATIVYGARDESTWLVVGSRGSTGEDLADASRPMVGREDELAQLERSFSRAVRESSVQLVTIVAEPGLGKSRLVQAFRDWIDASEELVTWRQGRCPPYGDTIAHAALSDIVKAQTGILDSDPPDVAHGKLENAVRALVAETDIDDQLPWLVARLAPLVGLPSTDTPQEELFTAWRRFLESLATTGPLVLVFEDLHWADESTLAFLAHVLDWTVGVPLVILATARPELYDRTPAWAAGHRNAVTLTLTPLSDVETAQLLTTLLGTRVLPAELHAALLTRAAGNPLYAREYVSTLTVQPEPDRVRVEEQTLSLPGTVQAVIAARLDTLPADSKRLLQAASVIGHLFWSGALAAITEGDESTVQARLHELVRRDHLRPSRSSRIADQAEYTFAHALIADVAYAQLPRSERGRLHVGIAEWHAARVTDADVSPDSAVVAFHYQRAHEIAVLAGDTAALAALAAIVATWCTHAAEHARTTDLHTALAYAARTVALTAADEPARARRLILLGDLQALAGLDRQAEETLAEAGRVATDVNHDPTLRAYTLLRLSRAVVDYSRCLELVTEAISILEGEPVGLELVEAYRLRAWLGYYFLRPDQQAVAYADRALHLIDRLDVVVPAREVISTLRIRGVLGHFTGEPAGIDYLRQALDLATEHNETDLKSVVYDDLASCEFFMVSAGSAVTYAELAVESASECGLQSTLLAQAANLVELYVIIGRTDEAVHLSDEVATLCRDVETVRAWNGLRSYQAWAFVVRGDADRARQTLRVFQEHVVEEDDVGYALLLALELQGPAPKTGSPDDVAAVLSFLEDPDRADLYDQYLARLARVLVANDAVDSLVAVIEHTPTAERKLVGNNILSARAVLAEALEQVPEALTLFEEAAVAWQEYGYPLEQAHALIGTARCLSSLGRSARPVLQQAHDILEEIGARPLLEETRRLLASAAS